MERAFESVLLIMITNQLIYTNVEWINHSAYLALSDPLTIKYWVNFFPKLIPAISSKF